MTDVVSAGRETSSARVSTLERVSLVAFFILIVAFGGLTLVRSAFLTNRHTDAGVYFRAAWAVRAGDNIYVATDGNGWHYHYPPLLATLMVPLADPPPALAATPDRPLTIPYPVSVVIWYVLCVVAIAAGVHVIVSAIEDTASARGPPDYRYSRLWWQRRMYPIFLVLPPIAHSLGRGQVNPILILCLGAMAAALMRRRSGQAGLWLAAAISIKVFPAYLLLVPFWRRDWRMILACGAGLVAGMLLVPAVIAGPWVAIEMLQGFAQVLFGQLIGGSASIRTGELFNEAAGDLMSFRSIVFKLMHLWQQPRPTLVPQIFSVVHVALAGLFTAATLAAMSWLPRKPAANEDPLVPLLFVGALITVSVPMVPTAQSHYYALSIVLAAGLVELIRQNGARQSVLQIGLLVVAVVLSFIREVPGLSIMTDLGAPVWSGLVMWSLGIAELWRRTRAAH